MQNKPSNDQHKSIYYRLRRSDPHERLSARLRHFSFGAAVFFVVAAAGIVTHSLYNIQIKQGATFRQYAAQQQLLDSTIQATRGEIYDASGITLASTSVVWTIWADPSYSTALFTSQTVEETGEAVKTVDETTLADVSRQLTLRLLSGDGESLDSVDTSSAEYQTQYQTVHDALAKNGSSYQVLATKVNNAVKLSIEKYISEYNKDHAKAKTLEDGTVIKKGRVSVSSSKSFQRDYPYGAFAASVLGFCNGDGEGFYGLEKSYNDTLAGVNGRTITLRNAYGNAIADANATTYAAKDGSNLVLSLDVNVQEVVERYLNEAIYANTVENRGAAIVMNVKTGAILAMASKPDFDPNAPLDFSENLAYLNEQVNAEPEIYTIYKKDADGNYLRDEQGKKIPEEAPDYTGTYRDIQWKNKTITELYYPGSVFKVITAAMGVDSGKATYYTTFNCSGAYGVAKETYHCAGKKAHGCLLYTSWLLFLGLFGLFAVVFEPHAGIQDVSQKVRVLHAGQTLEASGALGQQQLEDLPHLFLVAGLTAEGAQRIVCALFLVPCQVIVGVQQVDEFAQMEADAPQLRRPVVLLVVEQLGHQFAEAARHSVKVLAAVGFQLSQLVEAGADGVALSGPALCGGLSLSLIHIL